MNSTNDRLNRTVSAGEAIEGLAAWLERLKPCTEEELRAVEASTIREAIERLRSDIGGPSDVMAWLTDHWVDGVALAAPAIDDPRNDHLWFEKWSRLRPVALQRRGLVAGICGKPCRGKSTMACAVLWETAGNRRSARYEALARLMCELNDARYEGRTLEVFDRLSAPRVLVVDGNWQAYQRWSALETLRCVITERCSSARVTLLVGDGSKEDFDAAVGESIGLLINRTGGTVLADWEPFAPRRGGVAK